MKKFSRCILILLLVAVISGVGAYFYEDKALIPMYESVAKLYVVPGEASEASIRAKDGGLNDDFVIIFSSDVVLDAAKAGLETSDDLSQYLTVSSPPNSNIIELKVVNADQLTAKNYVDAIARAAVNTTSIIPVVSISILSEGTSTDKAYKPEMKENMLKIMALALGATLAIEIIVCLFISAFKKKPDYYDDFDYDRRFGRYAYLSSRPDLLEIGDNNSKRKDSRQKHVLASIEDKYDDTAEDVDTNDIEDTLKNGDETMHFPNQRRSSQDSREAAASKESKVKIIGRIRK